MSGQARTPERIQRYDMVTNYRCGSCIEELERADDGEWVRYEDVAAQLDASAAEIAVMRLDVKELRQAIERASTAAVVALQSKDAEIAALQAERDEAAPPAVAHWRDKLTAVMVRTALAEAQLARVTALSEQCPHSLMTECVCSCCLGIAVSCAVHEYRARLRVALASPEAEKEPR